MKPCEFLIYENKNIYAYGNEFNEKVTVILKPDCDKKVREMWKKLNEPIKGVKI